MTLVSKSFLTIYQSFIDQKKPIKNILIQNVPKEYIVIFAFRYTRTHTYTPEISLILTYKISHQNEIEIGRNAKINPIFYVKHLLHTNLPVTGDSTIMSAQPIGL